MHPGRCSSMSAARLWSSELLSRISTSRSWWLPELAESTDSVGTLDGVPVAAGAGDQAAAAVGAGITGPGPLSVVLGTSGVVLAATNDYLSDREGRVHAFCHAVPDRWMVMGVMLSAAGSLAWYHDTLLPDVHYDTMLGGGGADRARDATGLTFLPYLAGERTPHADPDARGAFCGLSVTHSRGALTRAVLEGRCLRASRLPRHGPRRGGRSDAWTRLRRRVEKPALAADRRERARATTRDRWPPTRDRRSAPRCSAASPQACTETLDEASAACVRVSEVIEPVAAWIEPYREARHRFRDYYPALRSVG